MIQIDIPMPKCCDDCFALDDHGDYPFCLISRDQRGYTFNTQEKRMPTCPLKTHEPVTPTVKIVSADYTNGTEYACPNCSGSFFRQKVSYCPWCGRKVKWDD